MVGQSHIPLPSAARLKLMLPRASVSTLAVLQGAAPLLAEAGILDGPAYLAMWLAQAGHESRDFEAGREDLDYSAASLLTKFNRGRISETDCLKFGRTDSHPANQQALANILYGGAFGRTQLGNTEPGDGWRYRGGGGLQATGRAAYRQVGGLVHMDLEGHPELVETATGKIATAIGVWRWKKLGQLMTAKDPLVAVTRMLNGGMNGVDDRRARYHLNLEMLRG